MTNLLAFRFFIKIVIKLLMMQPMIDTPFAIRNLFTFGELQLQECLHEVNKAKFPFPQSAKIKKNPLLHKLVS